MSYECEDCGAAFDTLSRLRLHDCSSVQSTDKTSTNAGNNSGEDPFGDTGHDRTELERDYPDVVGDLPTVFADARDGDLSALYRAIAEYETALTNLSYEDASSDDDLHHDLLFAYYEPLARGLDIAAQSHGWDVLVEIADAYNPREQDEFPEVGHIIANAIGRSVIRTRRSEGIEAIPTDPLAYLGTIPEYIDEFAVAYEESYTYGWGIGHPEHSVADQLIALAEDEPKFVKITLNTAFYVDQHEAIDVFETIVTDEDISGTFDRLGLETDLTEFYFRAVADLETDQLLGPHAPPYWDGADDLDRVLDVDPGVKQRIRDLAYETGVADGFPAEWSLRDLDSSPMSEMLGLMSEPRDKS